MKGSGIIGLSIITLGIYSIVWYYMANKELAEIGQARGTEECGTNPVLSLLAYFPGGLISQGVADLASLTGSLDLNLFCHASALLRVGGPGANLDHPDGLRQCARHLELTPAGEAEDAAVERYRVYPPGGVLAEGDQRGDARTKHAIAAGAARPQPRDPQLRIA